MKYAQLPCEATRLLPFYLAMEEYVATVSSDDIFFTWQVEPTVIFGRNQLVETEVNTDYCRSNGINFFRRKSGGGCVYADKGNIMLSYVVNSIEPATDAMRRYASLTAGALRELGVNAEVSGRNDVAVYGKKISGFAVHQLHNRVIVHSTMLYDFDPENMEKAIRPSELKLNSKGVDSVRSHVTSLSRCGIKLDIPAFIAYLRNYMCGDEVLSLSLDDERRIALKAEPYFDNDWLYGKNPRSEFITSGRFDGIGEFQVQIHTSGNNITHFVLAGDYFGRPDAADIIESALRGRPFDPESVAQAVDKVNLPELIPGFTRQNLLQLIFK